jgi:hypothetical protein
LLGNQPFRCQHTKKALFRPLAFQMLQRLPGITGNPFLIALLEPIFKEPVGKFF